MSASSTTMSTPLPSARFCFSAWHSCSKRIRSVLLLWCCELIADQDNSDAYTAAAAIEIVHTYSYTSDTPDFWRREGEFYPRHAGRFTGEPAYFHHVSSATNGLLERSGMKPEDFRFAVFHMPNGKFPLRAGKAAGFKPEQLEQGWVVNLMGNTYSGSSPTGLASCLDVANPGDNILITSFGSGAGSDSFVIRCTDRLAEIQKKAPATRDQLADGRIYLDYGKYVAYRGKIRMNQL